jgi:hypothetical protein
MNNNTKAKFKQLRKVDRRALQAPRKSRVGKVGRCSSKFSADTTAKTSQGGL